MFNSRAFSQVAEAFRGKKETAEFAAERRRHEAEQAVQGIKEIHAALHDIGLTHGYIALSGGDIETAFADLRERTKRLQDQKRNLLIGAGYPPDYTDVRYDCPACRDSGYDDTGRMCSCFREALIAAQLDVSGLGELAKTQNFENFELKYYGDEARERISLYRDQLRTYAREFKGEGEGSWLLTGAAGLGKTHLSTATAAEIVRKGFNVLYFPAVDLFEIFGSEKFGHGERAVSSEQFYDADLLLIDDLGTELTNSFTSSCLFSLVDKRIIKRLPTIINTNLSGAELMKKYGDRTSSRIFGYYRALQFEGRDIRLQKLAEGRGG